MGEKEKKRNTKQLEGHRQLLFSSDRMKNVLQNVQCQSSTYSSRLQTFPPYYMQWDILGGVSK